jgi:phosphoesterase RecJ-like protein
MKTLAQRILKAQTIILSTHRQCDGDGLGAQLALFHALSSAGKKVRIINVDSTPRKYRFLEPDRWIQYFDSNPDLPSSTDLVLIFDTNDERLVEPLYSELRPKAEILVFVDHHPILSKGPHPSKESWIDTSSASTGEMAYRLIKELNIPINREVARCLYTSITFDTQLYRFVRNSSTSHRIAAEMIDLGIDTEEIHRHLFGNQTVKKMAFLARTLAQIEYFCEGKLALVKLSDSDLFHYNLEPDESRDVIDILMNIETLEAAALFREEARDQYKVSLRSKGKIEVLSVAENLGGGGHIHASGAFVKGNYANFRDLVVEQLSSSLKHSFRPKK